MLYRPPTALTIAGNDSSGGAGIQADLKTFSALGCYGMSVMTAIPIQNTLGVKSIHRIAPQCVQEQLRTVLEDLPVDAIKIGMLHLPEHIEIISQELKSVSSAIVLDPVMMAKNGCQLMTEEAIGLLKKRLFPLVTLLTPNLSEASALLGRETTSKNEMEQSARELIDWGLKAVLIKGGHLQHHLCEDCLCLSDDQKIFWFSAPRIATKNTHGTGCTLSSAIAAYLARGFPLIKSINLAKSYLSKCIEGAQQIQLGCGNGPIHHFHHFWNLNQKEFY